MHGFGEQLPPSVQIDGDVQLNIIVSAQVPFSAQQEPIAEHVLNPHAVPTVKTDGAKQLASCVL